MTRDTYLRSWSSRYPASLEGAVPKGTGKGVLCRPVTRVSSRMGLLQRRTKKRLTCLEGAVPKGTGGRVLCRLDTWVSFLKGLFSVVSLVASSLASSFALVVALIFSLLIGCAEKPEQNQALDLEIASWSEIKSAAKNSKVTLTMWQGDPFINTYMADYVVPTVRDSFGVELKIANGQGNFIVQSLMAELQAGKEVSALDMIWINGETFYQLRQIDALHGPWVEKLPNARYIDFENPFIGTDFQQPVGGYECPWGNVQLAIIYNSERVPQPPMTRDGLKSFVQENPGKFTFDNHFTGLTFLKGLLIDLAGGGQALSGPFDETKYARYSPELWSYIKELKPFLWKQGNTFPESVAPMHQMFANGELWFTMSNNDSEVDNKISQGLFPPTAKAYVPSFGTIQNSHFMGITKNASNKAGAMVVINFLISLEAQLKKADPRIWGDGTVLSMHKIPALWKQKFEQMPNRKNAPSRAEIQQYALMELAPEYMIRLAEDFQTYVVQSN